MSLLGTVLDWVHRTIAPLECLCSSVYGVQAQRDQMWEQGVHGWGLRQAWGPPVSAFPMPLQETRRSP